MPSLEYTLPIGKKLQIPLCVPSHDSPQVNKLHLCSRHNTPSPNDVICVSSEQGLSIRTPCQADTLWLSALLANGLELGFQLIDLALLLQIKDNDVAGSGSAEPVSVGGENEGVNLITGVQGVKVL